MLKISGVNNLLTNDYSSKVKLCREQIVVILHVSTLFFLRHLVSLSRAMELDVQFMKTIASDNYACEYGVHLTMTNRCQYHTVRPAIATRCIPLLDITSSDPPIGKTAMVFNLCLVQIVAADQQIYNVMVYNIIWATPSVQQCVPTIGRSTHKHELQWQCCQAQLFA